LGAFARLREATIGFIMTVRPYGKNSAPNERIFMKLSIFRKSVEKIQV